MHQAFRPLFLTAFLAVWLGCANPLPSPNSAPRPTTLLARLPLAFEPGGPARGGFVAHGAGYEVGISASSVRLSLRPSRGVSQHVASAGNDSCVPSAPGASAVSLELMGARRDSPMQPEAALPGHMNYFIGSNPSRWRTNVPTYQRIRCPQVYPGIDLVYYGAGRDLEYDFVVAPKGDPRAIQLKVGGADSVSIEPASGDALFHTATGAVRQHRPVAYQMVASRRIPVRADYVLGRGADCDAHGGEAFTTLLSLKVGEYDTSRPLIVDPTVTYLTYFGGTAEDEIFSAKCDASGNLYVTGTTWSGNYPVLGAYQPTGGGQEDVFVTKLNAAGTAVIYSTYLGGGSAEWPAALVVDAGGSTYLCGTTQSSNFPTFRAVRAPGGARACCTLFDTWVEPRYGNQINTQTLPE